MNNDEGVKKLININFAITGTMALTRKGICDLIEFEGGQIFSEVSKKIDYLIFGDSPKSKLTKAQELDIEIISEKDFIKLFFEGKIPNFIANQAKIRKLAPKTQKFLNEILWEKNYLLRLPILDLEKNKYIFFDIETNAFHGKYGDILEFGYIIVDKNEIIDSNSFFIKPKRKISSRITKINGITNDMVENAMLQKDGVEKIKQILEDSDAIAVAHNGFSFDIPFINYKLAENNIALLETFSIDTLKLSRLVFPEFKSHKQISLVEELNITFDKSRIHRANYDCKLMLKIFQIMNEKLKLLNQNNAPFFWYGSGSIFYDSKNTDKN